jgi:3-oxoacyl-[acyl-carrier protein] reductase
MKIVVTGASKGIGLATVRRFAADTMASHSFALCARNESEMNTVCIALQNEFPRHTFFSTACDVSVERDVAQFVTLIDEQLGTADIVVKPVSELTSAEFRSVLGTNVRGVYLLTRALLPAMRHAKHGTIITISSLAGKNGFAGGTAYCASKFAVKGFMQNLFTEVRSDNIRCITIFPGSVDTAFFANIGDQLTSPKKLAASDVAEAVWFASHLPETATVSEIELRPTNPKG